MFLDNKYTKTYYRIINRARSRPKPKIYTEKHHIIPDCMGGKKMVHLTFKEHWTCHHLLMKMVIGKYKMKMYYAFIRMGCSHNIGRIVNSQMYERIKTANRKLTSGKNNPMWGKKRKHRPETIEKMRNSHKGIKFSKKHKKHLSEALKGKQFSKEHKKHLSERIITDEWREKLRQSAKERLKDPKNHPMYGKRKINGSMVVI